MQYMPMQHRKFKVVFFNVIKPVQKASEDGTVRYGMLQMAEKLYPHNVISFSQYNSPWQRQEFSLGEAYISEGLGTKVPQ